MKAKMVFGIAACAAACVSAPAFANTNADWFNGAASGDALTATGATWKQNAEAITQSTESGVTVANGLISLENDSESPLELHPAADSALNDGLITISATAVLTPCEGDMETVSGACAGFAVHADGAATNYCCYVGGVWTDLSGATPPFANDTVGATTFKIVIDYRTHKAKFYVTAGGTDTLLTGVVEGSPVSEFDVAAEKSALGNVAAFGTGSLTSVDAKYERAVCAVGTTKYGSLAEAIAAGGTAASILDVTESGIGESATSESGLSVAVCKALGIDTTAENPPAVAIVPVAADSDPANVTLQLDPEVAVEDGVAVTFEVRQGETPVAGSPFASGAIKVPLSAGTYTIKPAGVAAAGN